MVNLEEGLNLGFWCVEQSDRGSLWLQGPHPVGCVTMLEGAKAERSLGKALWQVYIVYNTMLGQVSGWEVKVVCRDGGGGHSAPSYLLGWL